jgi:1-acyl-sn-glycerol-3-phosphate acyltransferase
MGYMYSAGWRGLTIVALRPMLYLMARREWRGGSNIPRTGGVIIAANHISESDPLAVAHYLYENGRYPIFMAKSTLFGRGFVGRSMRGTGQIPVDRGGPGAVRSLKFAEEAVAAGQCVVVYPEGTCTRDPDLWPMAGYSGVSRLALSTNAPVIPLASWGAHELLPYRKSAPGGLAESLKPGLHLLPPKRLQVISGPPVNLEEYKDQRVTRTTLRAMTTRVMRAITNLVEELRSEPAPAQMYGYRESIQD